MTASFSRLFKAKSVSITFKVPAGLFVEWRRGHLGFPLRQCKIIKCVTMEMSKEKLETVLLLFILARKPVCGALLKSLTLCAGWTIPIIKKKKNVWRIVLHASSDLGPQRTLISFLVASVFPAVWQLCYLERACWRLNDKIKYMQRAWSCNNCSNNLSAIKTQQSSTIGGLIFFL